MKSIKERLAEKDAKRKKEEAKLSGRVMCFTVRIPLDGGPPIEKQSDLFFHQKKAKQLVSLIRSKAAYQYWEAVKQEIERIEMENKSDSLEEWNPRECHTPTPAQSPTRPADNATSRTPRPDENNETDIDALLRSLQIEDGLISATADERDENRRRIRETSRDYLNNNRFARQTAVVSPSRPPEPSQENGH